MLKILTVIGARPQFVKAAVVSRAISAMKGALQEVIVHTGQHYDRNMSAIFFKQLNIPRPVYNLRLGGLSHGAMTGRMIEGIEKILIKEKPDITLIYGDTDSTLAGAIAAAKLHVKVAHVEAGLRSFNMEMPEEINRILSDRISSLLFCPTKTAVANLRNEGIVEGVHDVGDVMMDAALYFGAIAEKKSSILRRLGLDRGKYALVTCHRPSNTDNPKKLTQIVSALSDIAKREPVILPAHPRLKKVLEESGVAKKTRGITIIEPMPYLDMLMLEKSASVIITDSGGIQKEAYIFGVPCVTMREETEWVETIKAGWNTLAGADRDKILSAYASAAKGIKRKRPALYGDGNASQKIAALLLESVK